MTELKTNTVKHVYSLRITSETESWQTIVTAESLAEALKIAAEQRDGLDRRHPCLPLEGKVSAARLTDEVLSL